MTSPSWLFLLFVRRRGEWEESESEEESVLKYWMAFESFSDGVIRRGT